MLADEQAQATEQETTQEAPQAKTFSEEQVAAMVAEAEVRARNSAEAEARRRYEGKAPKAQSQAKAKPDEGISAEMLTKMMLRSEAASSVKLTPAARARLFQDMNQADPEDPHRFVGEWFVSQGYAAQQEAMPPNNQSTAPKPATQKPASERPISDQGAPLASSQGGPSDDVLKWGSEELQAYMRQNGKVPGNMYDVRNRPVLKELRRRAEAQLANLQIYVGPPKR